MNCAYDKNMTAVCQRLMGSVMDFCVYGLMYSAHDSYGLFLKSEYADKVESGDSKTIMGMSGIELAYEITKSTRLTRDEMDRYTDYAINGRSPEYWSGWALAYYQWRTGLKFSEINSVREFDDIIRMYNPYHEMDISKFCDRMDSLYREANPETRLKKIRTELGISQASLSDMTGIPLKTLQQYEQRQKNINKANVDYLVVLSRAMSCNIEQLIEKV